MDALAPYPPLDTPARIPEVFAAAWNRRDPDAIAALFDEDAEFVNVTGLWWHDRAAIREAHAYGLERIFNDSTLRTTRVTVKHLSDTIAVVHARMRLTGQTAIAGTDQPGVRHTIFSFVVHTGDPERGPWRCASAHNTDVAPGMETNVVDDDGQLRPVDYRTKAGGE